MRHDHDLDLGALARQGGASRIHILWLFLLEHSANEVSQVRAQRFVAHGKEKRTTWAAAR